MPKTMLPTIAVLGALVVCCPGANGKSPGSGNQAGDSSGARGGLVVRLGCPDDKPIAGLPAAERTVLQILDSDPARVAEARGELQSTAAYGRVSVEVFDGRHLPYVDNLVNLLVAETLGQVPEQEVLRVLAPGGVAQLRGRRMVKPWPAEIDEWTHWLHDPSGNAVSGDLVVGAPRHFQWTASPAWSVHHDTVLSTSAMVTAGGRVFAIVNEAPISEFHEGSEGKWSLIARDAFNGLPLWKVPIRTWGWKTWGESFTRRFAQPMQLPSRLVAVDGRVYVTLGFHAPLSVLDAATGAVVGTWETTGSVDEILVLGDRLILSVYDAGDHPEQKVIQARQRDTGGLLWSRGPYAGLPARYDAVEPWAPVCLTADQERVVLVTKDELVCLELDTGAERWRRSRPAHEEHRMHLGVRQSENPSLVNHGELVLLAQPAGTLPHTNHTVSCDLFALSAQTGEIIWQSVCGTWAWGHPADVFVIDDLVWVHEHIPTAMDGPSPVNLDSLEHALLGLDLRTGEVRRRIPTEAIFRIGHHHRCYRNKATARFIFTARRGTEAIALDSGELRLHPWLRSECRYGILPGNGLLYTAPHPCACYAGVSLTGYTALAAERSIQAESLRVSGQPRLVTGTVKPPDAGQEPWGSDASDWPIHRGDEHRSGSTQTSLAGPFASCWRQTLRAPLSAVTAAAGRVYVAEKDRHRVICLDADQGQVKWRFTAGGRIDSPPTATDSCVVFGSADGCVYCLRADDGLLIWRFRAAPSHLRMVADGQIESVWPVHGSVLVQGDQVLALAGRSTYVDGGISAVRLDLATGKLLEENRICHERFTDRQALVSQGERYDHYHIDGAVSDLLVSDGHAVYLKAMPVFGDRDARGELLSTQSGFLDGSLFERSFWYLTRPGGDPVGAQLIVHDDTEVFGFRAYPSPNRGGPWHVVGTGYTLFAARLASDANTESRTPAGHVPDFTLPPFRDFTWRATVPVRVRSMVLAEDSLLVGGSPDDPGDGSDPYAALEGRRGGRLMLVSRGDGKTIWEDSLAAVPVWDGIAVADGRVIIALEDGSVVCLSPKL